MNPFPLAYFSAGRKTSQYRRWGHSAVSIGKHLYCFGGHQPNSNSKEHDPFFKIDSVSLDVERCNAEGLSSRDSHSAIRVGGKVLVWGGMIGNEGDTDVNLCFSLNLEKRKWTRVKQQGAIPQARNSHSAVAVKDRWLLLFGGNSSQKKRTIPDDDFHLLDTNTMIWRQVTKIGVSPAPRQGASMTVVGTQIFLFGGQGACDNCFNDLYELILDEIESDRPIIRVQTIRCEGLVPPPRVSHAATSIRDRYLIIIGGEFESTSNVVTIRDEDQDKRSEEMNVRKDIWAYDAQDSHWYEIKPKFHELFTGRLSFSATSFGDSILIVGGLKNQRDTNKEILVLHLKEPAETVAITARDSQPKQLKLERSNSSIYPLLNKTQGSNYLCMTCRNTYNLFEDNENQTQMCKTERDSLSITEGFIDSLAKMIKSPFSAIGLLLECELGCSATNISIRLDDQLKEGMLPVRYLHMHADSKDWSKQDFSLLHTVFDMRRTTFHGSGKRLQLFEKSEEEAALKRRYYTMLKIAPFRLGQSMLYISKSSHRKMYFGLSTKPQMRLNDCGFSPLIVIQEEDIQLNHEMSRNMDFLIQNLGLLAHVCFRENLELGNHLFVYDMYQEFRKYELTALSQDMLLDRPELGERQSLKQYLSELFFEAPTSKNVKVQGSLLEFRGIAPFHKTITEGTTVSTINTLKTDKGIDDSSKQIDLNYVPQLSLCKHVQLRRCDSLGLVKIYGEGRLIKTLCLQGLSGVIHAPEEMRSALFCQQFENERLELNLVHAICRFQTLKRPRPKSWRELEEVEVMSGSEHQKGNCGEDEVQVIEKHNQ